MFDEVTKTEGGKRVARRGAFLAGSTVVQIVLVAFLIVAGERIRAAVKSEAVVEVKFVKQAAPKPPPPPPPAAKRPPSTKPKTEVKSVPPMAMIQPKTVEDEIKPPDPNEPEEDYGEGEEGGVVGGVVGGQISQAQRGYEEAPRYMTTGFKPPQLASRGCLAESMKIPPQLLDLITGPVTVKFAVYSNGAVGSIQILTPIPDPRIGDAIKRAITDCQWVPGSDAQGRATAIWVIQPLRFQ